VAGYVPIEVVIIAFGCFVALLLCAAGLVRQIDVCSRTRSRQFFRPVVLWCVGVMGTLCLYVWVCFWASAGFSWWNILRGVPVFEKRICVAIVVIGSFSILPAALLEWRRQRWGAILLVVSATICTAMMYRLRGNGNVYDRDIWTLDLSYYGEVVPLSVIGVLLPLWAVSLLFYLTSIRWRPFRFSTRHMLAVTACIAFALASTAGLLLKSTRAWAERPAAPITAREREHQGIVLRGREALNEFVAAAVAADPSRLDRARQQFHGVQHQLKGVGPFLVKGVLQSCTQQSSVEVRRELLILLASPESWKLRQAVHTYSITFVLGLVADRTEDIEIRSVAVKVLMNWCRWNHLAETMLTLDDRGQLVPAISQFVLDRAGLATGQSAYRLSVPARGEKLVTALPDLANDPRDIIPMLIALLEHAPPSTDVVPAAARSLGRLGPEAREALPALNKAASSHYVQVRSAAEEAIRQIEHREANRSHTTEPVPET